MEIHFEELVASVCHRLEIIARDEPQYIAACKSGEDFEKCVVKATIDVINHCDIGATVRYTPGSHAFPDIIIEYADGCKYGIEVKSSSSSTSKSWKINGNSVLGSTKEDVIDTYILFGKTAIGNQAFRFKRYEDSVANVAVTHSPRYAIDLDITKEETFFARSGLSHKQISESPDPIGMITTYFKSQGLQAWWLAESTPAAIRMFSDLTHGEQAELIGHAFAHFPELFSDDNKKFYRCALWMVMDRSVVSASLRDNFTAGGRADLSLKGIVYHNVPQIFKRLYIHRDNVRSALDESTIDVLRSDWRYHKHIDEDIDSKMNAWIYVTSRMFSSDDVNGYSPSALLMDLFTK